MIAKFPYIVDLVITLFVDYESVAEEMRETVDSPDDLREMVGRVAEAWENDVDEENQHNYSLGEIGVESICVAVYADDLDLAGGSIDNILAHVRGLDCAHVAWDTGANSVPKVRFTPRALDWSAPGHTMPNLAGLLADTEAWQGLWNIIDSVARIDPASEPAGRFDVIDYEDEGNDPFADELETHL